MLLLAVNTVYDHVNDHDHRSGTICGYSWRRLFNRPHNWVRNQKNNKLAAVIVGLFIAGLAYLDRHKVQAISQNGIDWVVDAITHVSTTMDGDHPGTLSNIWIPLMSSVSAGFAVGMVRG